MISVPGKELFRHSSNHLTKQPLFVLFPSPFLLHDMSSVPQPHAQDAIKASINRPFFEFHILWDSYVQAHN